ncbi:MAG TPA: hypothetical protein ENH09_02635, partial [Bacteroidetes bacterium]|nr:hypothetical protein [Bacteroidota bacterium]
MADPQKKVQFSEESIYKQKIAAFILEHYAIKATDISLHTLDYFIGKRFKELNKTFPEYYEYLIQNYHENGHEIKLLLDEITIQETYFFRDMGQFQALTEYVIPRLIELKRGKDQSLRIWSAGCSTGEEPYTIAMVLREYFPHILDWDILIRATDVNVFALQKARQGVYRKHSFRGVSDFIISKYFEQEKNMYSLKDTVKEMVSFDFFNLASDTFLPVGRGNKWDIIFCRNVLIYFHKERIKSLLKRFHSALSDSGYLFLGFSENIFSYSDDFESIHYENSFFYKKKSAAKIGEKKRSLSRRPKAEVKREKFKKCPFPNGAIRNPKAAEAIYEEKLKDILALFSLEKYEQAWNKIQHIKIVPSENLTEHLFIKV